MIFAYFQGIWGEDVAFRGGGPRHNRDIVLEYTLYTHVQCVCVEWSLVAVSDLIVWPQHIISC